MQNATAVAKGLQQQQQQQSELNKMLHRIDTRSAICIVRT